ncbi:MAG: hypothetical protein OXI26_00520 [bacterium]|nr:hypothetical protein [bacterium]
MTPTETERLQLQQVLTDVLHEGPAKTLMESLPPMDWHELATKTDLAAIEERTDIRFEALRTELGAKIDTGLTDLNAKIDTGLTDLNAKIDTGLAGVRGEIAELRGEMKSSRATQTYVFLVGLVVTMTPIYLALFTGFGT